MLKVVKQRPSPGYDLVEAPIPEPGHGELLVKIERVSICGSDINLYKWNDIAKQIASLPFTPGHEAVGKIVKLGPGATLNSSYKVGARVAVENHYYCGTCFQCTHDQPHICQRMGQYGHGKKTQEGGFAQYSLVPARYAYVLSTDITPQMACLLEPFGVAHHAVEEVEVKDAIVLVTGCGPVGQCAVGVARALGAKKVIASDVSDERLAVARKMGADVVVNPTREELAKIVLRETGGNGVGALIEASGAMSVVNNCFGMVRKGGRVLMLGIPKGPIKIANPLPDFLFRSLTIKTIHGRKIFHTWKESEKLLAQGLVDVSPVISYDVGMHDYAKAHELLIQGKVAGKILVDPNNLSLKSAL